MRTDWLKIVFVQVDGDTELAHAVDVVMVRTKRIYILIIKVNKLFSFSSSQCFLKEIEHVLCVLSSYTNPRESCGSCSHSISPSPKLPLGFV